MHQPSRGPLHRESTPPLPAPRHAHGGAAQGTAHLARLGLLVSGQATPAARPSSRRISSRCARNSSSSPAAPKSRTSSRGSARRMIARRGKSAPGLGRGTARQHRLAGSPSCRPVRRTSGKFPPGACHLAQVYPSIISAAQIDYMLGKHVMTPDAARRTSWRAACVMR